MKIALFGGSFDPPHNAHVAIANEMLRVDPTIQELWLIPDFQHHWKSSAISFDDRLAMAKLLETDKIKASDIGRIVAKEDEGKTYTIDIIRKLKATTLHEYVFIAGSDQLPLFPKWKEYDALIQELSFIIIPRVGFPISGDLPPHCKWLSNKAYEPLEDSSTQVRSCVKMGKSISSLVPKAVEEYIIKKGLYK